MLPKIDSLWNYRDPTVSEEAFRKLLARADGDAAYCAEVKTQIARALGLGGRFEQSHAVLDEVAAELDGTMPLVKVRLALERGRAFRSSGSPEQGRPFFEDAMTDAIDGGFEFYAVDAAHMIALAYEGADALSWHERALEMAESAEDDRARGWRGTLYNNLGWTYYDLGRFAEALELFVKHEGMLADQGKLYNESIARWAQGKVLRAMGRLDDALAINEALLSHPERQDNAAEGYTREELGECFLALGRAGESRAHFRRAHELLSVDEWLQENEAPRLERLRELGES
jgi:tetratricopeptide (TPR) repeat protein